MRKSRFNEEQTVATFREVDATSVSARWQGSTKSASSLWLYVSAKCYGLRITKNGLPIAATDDTADST